MSLILLPRVRRTAVVALAVLLTAIPAGVAPVGIHHAEARPAPDSFADLAEKLLPAVVTDQIDPSRL